MDYSEREITLHGEYPVYAKNNARDEEHDTEQPNDEVQPRCIEISPHRVLAFVRHVPPFLLTVSAFFPDFIPMPRMEASLDAYAKDMRTLSLNAPAILGAERSGDRSLRTRKREF
ncbi:MAG: hypothetical protein IKO92_01175, partial [Clostridia bacterium]|nr:hypothetical protein [Clostridia bacterium]